MDVNSTSITPPARPLPNHSLIHNLAAPSQHENHHHHHGVNLPSTSILIIIISVVFVVVIIAIFLLIQKLRSLKSRKEKDKIQSVLKQNNSEFIAHSSVLSFNSSPDVGNGCLYAGNLSRKPPAKSRGVQVFTYRELEMATDRFNEANVTENGRGGDGAVVYRGVLNDGIVAAIKMMHRDGKQMERAFRIEVDLLSRLHSPYLVELLGYCADQNHRLLIFEFMPLGTLQQQLHSFPIQHRPLDWGIRLRIALDCARALEYLHEHASPSVIHRDFKSSNVLLDQNFRAKVSDFGLAKTGSDKINGQISTRVLGTTGYLAPEYASTGKLTTKSDVYSYGVVLLELLTGRVPVDSKRPPGEHVLVSWALPRLTNREKVVEMVDPAVQGQYPKKDLIQVAAIAAMCVQPEADYRPLMTDVVQSLLPLVKNNFSTGSSSSYRFLDQTGSPRP